MTESSSRGGHAVKKKLAPDYCPYCGKSLKGRTWLSFLGHVGFEVFAERYFRGDHYQARRYVFGKWAAKYDTTPWNGAWAERPLPEADYSYGCHQLKRKR